MIPVDLTGRRFGELVVERESLERPHGRHLGRAWLCRCDCGKTAIRTTAQLNAVMKRGGQPCCRECSVELWMGSKVAKKRRKVEALKERYLKFGYLYNRRDDWLLANDVRRDMSDALEIPLPRLFDVHAQIPVHASSAMKPTPPKVLQARKDLAVWLSSVERMRRWLRWQLAVDHAVETYMSGLPRPVVEKCLYGAYYGKAA